MCGIIGAAANRDVTKVLLEGLKRLEYRGYDSAGIAVITNDQQLETIKALGKVQNLSNTIAQKTIAGTTGIAHTRWATHGKPSAVNAHPQVSANEIAIVHNGIIENHDELRAELVDLGYEFVSDTDTEVATHLIHQEYCKHKCLLKAVQESTARMHGAFSIGVIHRNNPNEIIATRLGSPLVIGKGIDENFIASDTLALKSFAQEVLYLEEGDCARITASNIEIYDRSQSLTIRKVHPLAAMDASADKGKYRHFMLKEIFEQPRVITDTLEGRIASIKVLQASFGENAVQLMPKVKNIHIVACGTSYNAGLVAKYWFETLARIPTQVEIASEYRYRDVVIVDGTLFITISQSGETADTLAALTKAKDLNYLTNLAICNVASSSLVRESANVFLTRAGIEIGVASSKAFTTQLVSLLMLATAFCADDRVDEVLAELKQLPDFCNKALKMNETIKELATSFANKSHALFLGRGVQYPVALEGSLKLKEISYIHAEAYPAGELKHGPLALVDKEMPVVAIAPNDELLDKLKSNLHEVSARGGELYVFVDDAQYWPSNGAKMIPVPSCGQWIAPIVYTIPLQLLAYHVAVVKGTDVDQPRNLAKSVTVE